MTDDPGKTHYYGDGCDHPHGRTFFVAQCQQCEPILDMPFYDEDERDTWAYEHATATEHVVLVRQK